MTVRSLATNLAAVPDRAIDALPSFPAYLDGWRVDCRLRPRPCGRGRDRTAPAGEDLQSRAG